MLALAGGQFLVAYAALGLGLYAFPEPVYEALARLARDGVVLTSPDGLVSGVVRQPPDRFLIQSGSLGLSVDARSLSLPFVLTLPPALALAVPSRRRWTHAAVLALACLLLGAAILSQDLLAILSRSLRAERLAVLPAWQTAFYRAWLRSGWDFAMIAVPTGACVWALRPLLDAPAPAGAGGGGGRRQRGGRKPRTRRGRDQAPARARPSWLAPAAAWCALLGTGLALDLWVSRRLADPEAGNRFLLRIGEHGPAVPAYFLRAGEQALARGSLRDAGEYYRRAALFPEARARAERGLAMVESRR